MGRQDGPSPILRIGNVAEGMIMPRHVPPRSAIWNRPILRCRIQDRNLRHAHFRLSLTASGRSVAAGECAPFALSRAGPASPQLREYLVSGGTTTKGMANYAATATGLSRPKGCQCVNSLVMTAWREGPPVPLYRGTCRCPWGCQLIGRVVNCASSMCST